MLKFYVTLQNVIRKILISIFNILLRGKHEGGKRMNKKNGAVSFIGLLQIVFIVLKLTNIIDWNWVIVLIPLIIDIALYVIVIIISIFITIFKSKKC